MRKYLLSAVFCFSLLIPVKAQELEFLPVFDNISRNDIFNYLGKLDNKRFVIKTSGGKMAELIVMNDSGLVIKRSELGVYQLQPLSNVQPYFWRDQLILSIVNIFNSYAYQGFIRIDKNGELVQEYTLLDSVRMTPGFNGFADHYHEAIVNNDQDKLFFYRAQHLKESNTLSLSMIILSEQGKILSQRKENLFFNDIDLTHYAFHYEGNNIYVAFYDKVARRGGKATVKIFEMKSTKLEPTIFTIEAGAVELGNLNFVTDPVAKKPIIVAFGKKDSDTRFDKILSFYKDPAGKKWIYSTAPFSKDLSAKIYPKRKRSTAELSMKELKLPNILWDDEKQAPLLVIEGNSFLSIADDNVSLSFPDNSNPQTAPANNAGPSSQFNDIRTLERERKQSSEWGKPVKAEGSLQGVNTGGNSYTPPSTSSFNDGSSSHVKILQQDLFIAYADGTNTGVTNPGISSMFSYSQLPMESFYYPTKQQSVLLLHSRARPDRIYFISVSKNGDSKQTILHLNNLMRPFYNNKVTGAGDNQLETLYTDGNNKVGIAIIKWSVN